MENTDEALGLFHQILETRRQVLGEDHPDTLKALGMVARMLMKKGDVDAARNLYIEELDLKKQRYGDGHCETAATLVHLAWLAKSEEEYPEARRLYDKAIRIYREQLPEGNDKRLLDALINLGFVLQQLKEFDQAVQCYLEVRDIRTRIRSEVPSDLENTISLGGVYCNLGVHYARSDQFVEALPYFEQAVSVLSDVVERHPSYGRANVFLVNSVKGQARVYGELGRYQESLDSYSEALRIAEPQHHSRLRLSRARAYAVAGDHRQAVAEASEVLASGEPSGSHHYNGACGFALAAAATERDDQLDDDKRASLQEEYARLAMQSLHACHTAGYFDMASRLETLQTDNDLDSLRTRADFEQFVRSIIAPKRDQNQ